MAVSQTKNGGPRPAPKTDAKKSPKDEPKKPQDNKAAKEAPKETKAATKTAFGDVPKNGANNNAKQPGNAPKNGNAKQPENAPKAPDNQAKQSDAAPKENTTPPAADAKAPPADGKAAPADGKAPPAPADNKTVPPDAAGTTSTVTLGKTPFGNPNIPKTSNLVVGDTPPPAHTADEGKTPPAGDGKTPPATDPKGVADPKAAADPKTAADPKAAPAADPKTAPEEVGTPVTDTQGQPVKTPDGNQVYQDKNKNSIPVGPDGKVVTDPQGKPYAVNDKGEYLQPEAGKYAVYDKNGNAVAADPSTGEIVKDANGNPYMVTPAGKYANAEGNNVVYDKNNGNKPVAVDAKGNALTAGTAENGTANPLAINTETGTFFKTPDGKSVVYDTDNGYKLAAADKENDDKVSRDNDGNPYKVMPDGQYAKTVDGNYVAYGKEVGGKDVAVDAATGKEVKDAYGNPLALNDNGKFITTPDGKEVVYNNNGNLTYVDPATGKIATDGSGNPYAVAPDGKYAQTVDGNYVVYDKANGDNMIAIDNKTGQAITDGKGRPVALDENGKYLKTPQGNTVVYDKVNGKFNLVATDKNGDPLVIGGKPAAVGKDGNYLQTPDGNNIVYDITGNPMAVDKDGKTIIDSNGYRPALAADGKYVPGAVYDKATGFKVKLDPDGKIMTQDGRPMAIDDNGNFIFTMEERRETQEAVNAVYDSRGVPVIHLGKTEGGLEIYKDVKTGELETMSGDYVYKIDPATKDLAKDANGNTLPPLYNPIDDAPTRPPVMPNENVETTLKNLPKGTERGDPMKIKDELFDENGNLDVKKVYDAAAKYDPRDIYDSLINAGPSGGWNNTPLDEGVKIVHPDEEQSRTIIAAVIAWQNMNGKYNPMKNGKMPLVVLVDRPTSYAGGTNQAQGIVYINANTFKGNSLATSIFHDLNHAGASKLYYDKAAKEGAWIDATHGDGKINALDEAVTEFLSNNWSGNDFDGGYEMPGTATEAEMSVVKKAIDILGGGDKNKGLDILQRAYFAGDPAAIEQFFKVYKQVKEKGTPSPYPYNDPSTQA